MNSGRGATAPSSRFKQNSNWLQRASAITLRVSKKFRDHGLGATVHRKPYEGDEAFSKPACRP